jgi:serine O-acetyltransferase
MLAGTNMVFTQHVLSSSSSRSSTSSILVQVIGTLLLITTDSIFCLQLPFVVHRQSSLHVNSYYRRPDAATKSGSCSIFHSDSKQQVFASFQLWLSASSPHNDDASLPPDQPRRYELGVGKNKPLVPGSATDSELLGTYQNNSQAWLSNENPSVWIGPILPVIQKKITSNSHFPEYLWVNGTNATTIIQPTFATSILRAKKKQSHSNKYIINRTPNRRIYKVGLGKNRPLSDGYLMKKKNKAMVGFDEQSQFLSRAVWNEDFFLDVGGESSRSNQKQQKSLQQPLLSPRSDLPVLLQPQQHRPSEQFIMPKTIHDYKYDPQNSIDTVWLVMRFEAMKEAQREPLLVSFLYSTILNHESLESALAFHLANLLSSPAMISTQVMSLCLEALHSSREFRESLRCDILAVRDRDPACTCLPDVFLYFKGFHALQTYRVAHYLWKSGRTMLAHHLQSQMSQVFQVDIHPNATLGHGIMLDHGTGIVIGGTAVVGHNCSILHHVTLGGTGKTGVDRHPKIGDGVLLGAGASILGNIRVGDGCQIGAGTLVIQDLPPHCVVVGVPAKIIGSFINVEMQPSLSMNQTLAESSEEIKFFETGGFGI